MHPENGPRCALRAFAKASHNRNECGQDTAPACKSPHATVTVVPAHVVLPNRTSSRSTPQLSRKRILSPRTPNTAQIKIDIRHLSKFNDGATIWHRRRVYEELYHRTNHLGPFALPTSIIFHTFPATHSRHYTAHFPTRRDTGMSARENVCRIKHFSPEDIPSMIPAPTRGT